jgi:polyhydroxyalkanoate synthesis repressor PhaR
MAKRLIKKYPNRRLYDTAQSKYVTLGHIRDLVRDGTDVQVVDAVSEEDLTRQILIQIITEEESGEDALFTTELLQRFIRLYQGTMPAAFSQYMERALELFLQQQQMVERQVQSYWGGSEATKALADLTEQNLKAWQEMQESFLRMAGSGKGGSGRGR